MAHVRSDFTDVLAESRAKLRGTADDDDDLLQPASKPRHLEIAEDDVPAINTSSSRQKRKLRTAAG